jgi:hypothetical protein
MNNHLSVSGTCGSLNLCEALSAAEIARMSALPFESYGRMTQKGQELRVHHVFGYLE